MGKLKTWQIYITICGVILGLMFMVQIRAQDNINSNGTAARLEDITATLIQVTRSTQQLAAEAEGLRNVLIQYQDGENIRSIISAELAEAKIIAGLVELQGPGVVITLGDSSMPRDWDEDYYYIHDWYLRDLVNLLWIGGAEAISINDERIISTTEIFCGGTTIFINKNLIPPPYVIRAIGDPNNLSTSLRMGSIYSILEEMKRSFAIIFTVQTEEAVTVPSYKGNVSFLYARAKQD